MWTRLDPKYMMGSLNYPGKDNYYRVDLNNKTKNPKHSRIVKYSPGCFFVFSAVTKKLSLRYSVHYRTTNQAYQPIKWGAEIIVFGLLDGSWQLLNHWNDNMSNAGGIVCDENITHDEVFTLSFNLLNRKYSEFQICLPSQGTINSLEIETDHDVKMKYVKPTLILCGSSVASGSSNSQSHHICTMAYRLFNKNYINAGIGGDHSFNCPELMHKVFSTKLPILVMDVFHIKDDILEKYTMKKLNWLIISSPAFNYEWCNYKKYKFDMANIDGDGHLDSTHLNSLGVKRYLAIMKKKGLI